MNGAYYVIYYTDAHAYLTRSGTWTGMKKRALALKQLKNIEKRYNKLSPGLKKDCIITER